MTYREHASQGQRYKVSCPRTQRSVPARGRTRISASILTNYNTYEKTTCSCLNGCYNGFGVNIDIQTHKIEWQFMTIGNIALHSEYFIEACKNIGTLAINPASRWNCLQIVTVILIQSSRCLPGRCSCSRKVPHDWLATLGEYSRNNNRNNAPNP